VARIAEDATTQPPPVSATPVDPSDAAVLGQDRARVAAAMKELPPEQRVVVELAYFEGLSQREIAERTGDPLGTVKTRARLALEKLASLLEGSRE
jgi:RNA polymerase sigma-70 factor (ECF subfamily)